MKAGSQGIKTTAEINIRQLAEEAAEAVKNGIDESLCIIGAGEQSKTPAALAARQRQIEARRQYIERRERMKSQIETLKAHLQEARNQIETNEAGIMAGLEAIGEEAAAAFAKAYEEAAGRPIGTETKPNRKANAEEIAYYAAWLRKMQAKNNLTQEELSTRIGVTFATINRILKGKRGPQISTKRKIANYAERYGIEPPEKRQ